MNLTTVRNKGGDLVAMNRTGSIVVQDSKGRELERHAVVYGATIKVERRAGDRAGCRCSSSTTRTTSPS